MSYLAETLELTSVVRVLVAHLLAVLQPESASLGPVEDNIRATLAILAALAGISVVLLVGGTYLSKTRLFGRMALSEVQAANRGYTACTYPNSLIGLQGITQTPLRPSGKAQIHGVCYDVKTQGTYVAPGMTVVVTDIAGTSLTVQAVNGA
jgi:membrane-bound serine protease (ClpP class)